MKIFRKLFPSLTAALINEGYQNAIKDIIVFKDKIYTKRVTLIGDNQIIKNCTFLCGDSPALLIKPKKGGHRMAGKAKPKKSKKTKKPAKTMLA